MSLKIILGLKSKNKSEYLYNMINEDVKKNNILLFVPSQKRVVVENEYMNFLNLDGIINLKITTISEYIKGVLKISNMHIDDKYLSDIDKKIIILKLINENKELLKKYKKVANKEGFVLEIANYIEVFRGLNINKKEEIDRLKEIKIENKNTLEKFTEILLIYEKYLEYINENNFLDDTSYIDLYNKQNDIKEEYEKIYFDGYNNFKNVEYEVIEMYLKNGKDIAISLVTDAKNIIDVQSGASSEIFEVSNDTYLRLIKLASKYNVDVFEEYIDYVENKPEDLKKLSTYTFNEEEIKSSGKCENIEVNFVKNEKSEIVSIAEKICKNTDTSFSDNVIFATDLDKYENIIKQVFYEYNIPYYIDKKLGMSQNLFIKYLLNLIDIVNNKNNIKNIIKTLKYGLNDIDENYIYILENYILEFNIFTLEREFTYNSKVDYDLENLNEIREKVLNIFLLDDKESSVNTYIEKLYKNLVDNNIVDNYLKYVNTVENEDEKKVLESAIKKLNEIVDSISKVYSDFKLSFKEFSDILKLSISKSELNKVPLIGNEVLILDINNSKTTYKKNVFIVGANEEEFPHLPNEDILFSDIELEELNSNGLKLKENVNSKLNMALYNIYEVLTLPQEKIAFYYKSSDIKSKALKKSNVLENIEKIFDIKENESVTKDIEKSILTFETLLDKLKDGEVPKQEKIAIFDYLNNDDNLKDVLYWYKNDENLKKETVDLIYKDKILSSVTKLENFKKCPFSYYLKYVLNIKKREEFEVSTMDLGTLMHGVIEDFSYYITKNNITFRECNDEEVFKKLEPEIDKMIEKRIESTISKQKESIKFKILKNKLVSTLKAVIKVIAKSFAQSEFTPYLFEAEFKENSTFAPIMIKLKDGKIVELVGKIDRVDTLKLQNKMYVRVVDYKSSNRDLSLDNIKEGISLQLLTYLSAFTKNMKEANKELEVVPAAMNYFTLSDNMLSLDDNMTDEEIKKKVIEKLRLRGIFLKDAEILNKMDNEFETQNRLIDVSKRSLTTKTNKLLLEDEYNELLESANDILKSISEEIVSGVVKILPNKKCDACKYCEYSCVCRKNVKV